MPLGVRRSPWSPAAGAEPQEGGLVEAEPSSPQNPALLLGTQVWVLPLLCLIVCYLQDQGRRLAQFREDYIPQVCDQSLTGLKGECVQDRP